EIYIATVASIADQRKRVIAGTQRNRLLNRSPGIPVSCSGKGDGPGIGAIDQQIKRARDILSITAGRVGVAKRQDVRGRERAIVQYPGGRSPGLPIASDKATPGIVLVIAGNNCAATEKGVFRFALLRERAGSRRRLAPIGNDQMWLFGRIRRAGLSDGDRIKVNVAAIASSAGQRKR